MNGRNVQGNDLIIDRSPIKTISRGFNGASRPLRKLDKNGKNGVRLAGGSFMRVGDGRSEDGNMGNAESGLTAATGAMNGGSRDERYNPQQGSRDERYYPRQRSRDERYHPRHRSRDERYHPDDKVYNSTATSPLYPYGR